MARRAAVRNKCDFKTARTARAQHMRLIAAELTPSVRDERDFELQRTPRERNKCDLSPRDRAPRT